MCGIILAAVMAMAVPALAEDAPEREIWQTDFTRFLSFIKTTEERGSFDLDTLKQRLVDRRVQWRGSLKYFRKGRPYIRESFVRVDKTTKVARVMFYAEPKDVKAWENLKTSAAVQYSGVISDVKLATGLKEKPFIYIDLRQVKVVKTENANKPHR